MTSVWKTKVLPGLNKIFDKDGKKAAAAEFLKSFNKEEIDKEIEDKKTELEPKVLEAVESSPPEIKALVKDNKKTASKVKKNSAAVTKFLDELAKAEFPGAKLVSDAVAKSGTTLLSPPIIFILDKVTPFLPKEEPKAEEPAADAAAPETTSREVAVEEEKKEEPAAEAAATSTEVVEEEKKEEEKKEEEKPAAVAEAAVAEATPAEPEKK